jgi:hypothetical protein
MSLPPARRPELIHEERCHQCSAVLLSIYKIPKDRPETELLGWLALVIPSSRTTSPPDQEFSKHSPWHSPPRQVRPCWVTSPDDAWRVRCHQHNAPRVVSVRDFVDFDPE